MEFRILSGPFTGVTGTFVTINVETDVLGLRVGDHQQLIEVPLLNLSLVNHEECGCDVDVQEVA